MSVDSNSPLRDLYLNKNDMPVLMYPNDLGTSRKGHYLTFSVLVPTKSTYKETGIASTIANLDPSSLSHFSAISSIQSAANQATSAISTVTDTIGAVASVANKALSTANKLAGTAASVVGVVSGAKSIITGGIASGSPLTALSGLAGGINGLSSLASTATSIPGVSGFLKDPMGSASSAFNSIKDFLNDPSKAFSSGNSNLSKDQTNGPKFTPSVVKPSGYINLYMPDTVSMNQHAAYNDLNMTQALGAAGGLKEGFAEADSIKNSAKSLYDQMKTSTSEGGGFGGAIKTLREHDYDPLVLEGIGMAGQATGAVNNGADVGKYLLKNSGYAINPQYEVVFSAMDMRTFQFDFTFTPKGPAEAQTVRDIIKLFRKHAAPTLHGGGGRYFDVPAVFQIEYMHLEAVNPNLHKFAPCVLQSIVVDYAPEVGWVTFNDGMPVKTRLTLMFKETEILTRDKIEQGY
jgi:hypothetical protein